MSARTTSLASSPDFLKLWAAETVSVFGFQITGLALPLTAAITLSATPAQMGVLGALETAPFLLFGLFAGALVDRVRRRPLMVRADIVRAMLLAAVPAAALLNALHIEVLYVVAFLVGIATLVFDVAYQSFLPSVVKREQLADGNAKLETSRALSTVLGPSLAGGLVQLVTAPIAIFVNALTFVLSAAFLGGMRVPEEAPQPAERPNVWREIGEGLKVVTRSPVLRSIAACTSISNFFSSAGGAVFVLFVTRDLNFSPSLLGTVIGVGGGGALLGALLAGRLPARLGMGPVIVLSSALFPLASVLVPLSTPGLAGVILVGVSQFVIGLGIVVYNVVQVSLRQAITPHRLLGRMNATMRFFVWGTMPLGALLGGALGTLLDLRTTLFFAALGQALAVLPVLLSPVRRLKDVPELPDER
ncbi:MFS transporter [Deinococcus yavapaiensis]|uniref:Putative MFS family arabinose efflux permease n=1 Tax=Deinococcus yavapaiensis KR-236 TaxID=694435 RepID=A0A318S1U5_9DEIO|nr:MFS transporter [Deinococcus yavapaiensis]PYE48985.1 putative MFS family arabinose efflux permease [Deinococcus yavapaiensis KR-236]